MTIRRKVISLQAATGLMRSAIEGSTRTKIELVFGGKDIAVKGCHQLPSVLSDVEISNGRLNIDRNAVPIELRILVREIDRRGVAKLPIHADLLEFMIQRVDLA